MASGDTLAVFVPGHAETPTSAYAQHGVRNNQHVLEFEDEDDWTAFFNCYMPGHYVGNTGVTIKIFWFAASVTTGTAQFEAAFERNAGQDVDSDGFAAVQNSGTDSCNATNGIETISSITFTDGSQMDSVVANDRYRLKLVRDTGAGTIAEKVQVRMVVVLET